MNIQPASRGFLTALDWTGRFGIRSVVVVVVQNDVFMVRFFYHDGLTMRLVQESRDLKGAGTESVRYSTERTISRRRHSLLPILSKHHHQSRYLRASTCFD